MKRLIVLALFVAGSVVANAQKPHLVIDGVVQEDADTLIVMTVPLKYLSAGDAVQLLSPYATTAARGNRLAGGVFAAPNGRAITIRERVPQYGRMLAVLRENDRPPRDVAFNYQVVLIDRTGKRAHPSADLDSLVTARLGYTGYDVIGSGRLRAADRIDLATSIPTKDFQYHLQFFWTEPPGTPASAAIRLQKVYLHREPWPLNGTPTGSDQPLLNTGEVQIPVGHTFVIGTKAIDRDRAIVLIMKPEVLPAPPPVMTTLRVTPPED